MLHSLHGCAQAAVETLSRYDRWTVDTDQSSARRRTVQPHQHTREMSTARHTETSQMIAEGPDGNALRQTNAQVKDTRRYG